MSSTEVAAPRLNANEDQALVADVLKQVGADVELGDLLFVLETTKAATEVLAPVKGRISALTVKKGDMVDVGAILCIIGESVSRQAEPSGANARSGETKVTAKAKLRAQELGVDLDVVVPVGGRVGVAEVEAHAAKSPAVSVEAKPRAAARLTSARAVMVGGGGHAATLADALEGSGWDLVGALDSILPVGTIVTPGLAVIGNDEMLESLFEDGVRTAFIGVGGATSASARRRVFEKLARMGFQLPPVVHKAAHVGLDVKLGPATYVMPSAMVGPRCRIGANVIVNSGCIVCHDSQVEDHAHITPGAIIAGMVHVGEESVIGMAATVLFGSKIGRGSVIHNSAAVVGDVGDDLQYTRNGQRLPKS
jgi:sugar O-acyltransferase (sialic acid O-acetyltransferase NeuD family)